jgi:CMP-N,N'-diacetyllegionaminic acid synthase
MNNKTTGQAEDQTLLAFIPARAGSKRLADKNVRAIAGRSLLELAIHSALGATEIDEIGLSTDSLDYLKLAAKAGHHEEYRRPPEVSGDHASTADTALDYLRWRSAQGAAAVTHLVLLQPTSPLRGPQLVDAAINAWRASGKPGLVSVARAAPSAGYLVIRDIDDPKGQLRTTNAEEEVFVLDGSIFITPVELLEREQRFWNADSDIFVNAYPRPYDIDDELDFYAAEFLIDRIGLSMEPAC